MTVPMPRGSKLRTGRLARVAGLLLGAGAAAIGLALACGQRNLSVSRYDVPMPGASRVLDGARIVQISDLHATAFGERGAGLIAAVRGERPDLIVLTGDILDRGTEHLDELLDLVVPLTEIAPCAAIPGNHEGGTELGMPLLEALEAAGMRVLRDETVLMALRGETVRVAGVDDPHLRGGPISRPGSPAIDHRIIRGSLERAGLPVLAARSDRTDGAPPADPVILLAHRPELLEEYAGRGIDLVLAGHAHGGQWRIPVIGGLYAPNQGPFPRLTAGVHDRGTTRMIVSRGLKVRTLLPRLGNPPEIVVAVLRSADAQAALRGGDSA